MVSYARPLGQTFNQMNLSMYRLPDGQRGALRTTSLALAREATKNDDRSSKGSGHSYNPFKSFKRLYSGFRKGKRQAGSPASEDFNGGHLRKWMSTPLGVDDAHSISRQASASDDSLDGAAAARCTSDGELETGSDRPLPPKPRSPEKPLRKVRFSSDHPRVIETYSADEYDRRVVDPWEFMTRDARRAMREEMSEYTRKEMDVNNVYTTNDSLYCTLCWRKHCHCRALSKDIWKRPKSTTMVRAGA